MNAVGLLSHAKLKMVDKSRNYTWRFMRIHYLRYPYISEIKIVTPDLKGTNHAIRRVELRFGVIDSITFAIVSRNLSIPLLVDGAYDSGLSSAA